MGALRLLSVLCAKFCHAMHAKETQSFRKENPSIVTPPSPRTLRLLSGLCAKIFTLFTNKTRIFKKIIYKRKRARQKHSHHPPVHHLDGAITGLCKVIVMRHSYDGLLVNLRKLFEDIKHHLRVF